MKLDERLSAAASAVRRCGVFADIGSDHALLPIYLILCGKTARAVAADVNPQPLARAKANAQLRGVADRMSFVLSDGFDAIEERFDAAAICGMGGQLMADILSRARNIADGTQLILQPMTAHDGLRSFLWSGGHEIRDEIFVTVGGKPYVIIDAVYRAHGIPERYTYSDLFLGKRRQGGEAFGKYLSKARAAALKRRCGLELTGRDTAAEDELIHAAGAELERLSVR